MESWLSRVKALYDDYIDKVQELERNRKPMDGLFGLRPGPADDPCHDRFAAELQDLLKRFQSTDPDSDACAEVLRHLFTAPEIYSGLNSAYWMLIAVQGFGIELIGFLSPDDARALAELYSARYPRRVRLPVQEKILKRLRQQAD